MYRCLAPAVFLASLSRVCALQLLAVNESSSASATDIEVELYHIAFGEHRASREAVKEQAERMIFKVGRAVESTINTWPFLSREVFVNVSTIRKPSETRGGGSDEVFLELHVENLPEADIKPELKTAIKKAIANSWGNYDGAVMQDPVYKATTSEPPAAAVADQQRDVDLDRKDAAADSGESSAEVESEVAPEAAPESEESEAMPESENQSEAGEADSANVSDDADAMPMDEQELQHNATEHDLEEVTLEVKKDDEEETSTTTAEQPSDERLAEESAPSAPGCYLWLGHGCPAHPHKDHEATWFGDRSGAGSYEACEQRKQRFDKYCQVNSTLFKFVDEVTTTAEEVNSTLFKFDVGDDAAVSNATAPKSSEAAADTKHSRPSRRHTRSRHQAQPTKIRDAQPTKEEEEEEEESYSHDPLPSVDMSGIEEEVDAAADAASSATTAEPKSEHAKAKSEEATAEVATTTQAAAEAAEAEASSTTQAEAAEVDMDSPVSTSAAAETTTAMWLDADDSDTGNATETAVVPQQLVGGSGGAVKNEETNETSLLPVATEADLLPTKPVVEAEGSGGEPAKKKRHKGRDPHLTNMHGDRFDLYQPGVHALLQIPRRAEPEDTKLRVEADAGRMGSNCADLYFQVVNITGSWADDEGGGLVFFAEKGVDDKSWRNFGEVSLKVVGKRTGGGVPYLNVFFKHLKKVRFPVGGLIGEDDHALAATPGKECDSDVDLHSAGPAEISIADAFSEED